MDDTAFLRLFNQISALGEFHMRRGDHGGWHASVKFPAPEGVTAECRSDFRHETPLEALQCLHDRLGGLQSMVNIAAPVPGIAHMEIVK
jgi:hypothetical protein